MRPPPIILYQEIWMKIQGRFFPRLRTFFSARNTRNCLTRKTIRGKLLIMISVYECNEESSTNNCVIMCRPRFLLLSNPPLNKGRQWESKRKQTTLIGSLRIRQFCCASYQGTLKRSDDKTRFYAEDCVRGAMWRHSLHWITRQRASTSHLNTFALIDYFIVVRSHKQHCLFDAFLLR